MSNQFSNNYINSYSVFNNNEDNTTNTTNTSNVNDKEQNYLEYSKIKTYDGDRYEDFVVTNNYNDIITNNNFIKSNNISQISSNLYNDYVLNEQGKNQKFNKEYIGSLNTNSNHSNLNSHSNHSSHSNIINGDEDKYKNNFYICPVCYETSIKTCNCQYKDSQCNNGHKWYKTINGIKKVGTSINHTL
jgi:hypothetical protein